MCLAIPGKVLKIDAKRHVATIDYEAEQREAGTALLPDLKVGEYVLVQARMVIQRVPAREAKAALRTIANAPVKKKRG
jgi:hydrogenase assembly chaperone HypC/HupF